MWHTQRHNHYELIHFCWGGLNVLARWSLKNDCFFLILLSFGPLSGKLDIQLSFNISFFIAPINEETFWEKLRLLALQVIILQIRGGIDISWVWFLTNVTHTNKQRKRERERERAECMHIIHGTLGIVSLVTCVRQLLHIFWWWEMM